MSHFCLLREAASYVAQDWDLLADDGARQYWLDWFRQQFAEALKHAAVQYGRKINRQAAAAQQQFFQCLDDLQARPASLPGGRLTVLDLARLRDKALRDNGIEDGYAYLRDRENRAAAAIYGPLVRKLHALPAAQKWLQAVQGALAGNAFESGAPQPAGARNAPDFGALFAQVKPRPWKFDDFDRLAADLGDAPPAKWSKALVFLNKAGADFVLGALPFVRELGLAGTKIVLAANDRPSLLDMTADEAAAVVEQFGRADDDLASLIAAGMIEVVSTGGDSSLLDLADVSDELNEAAQGAELVVLLGMGRAVQSNWRAAFSVDCLKLALLKDARVAQRLGAEAGDCVCKYEPAPAPPAA